MTFLFFSGVDLTKDMSLYVIELKVLLSVCIEINLITYGRLPSQNSEGSIPPNEE